MVLPTYMILWDTPAARNAHLYDSFTGLTQASNPSLSYDNSIIMLSGMQSTVEVDVHCGKLGQSGTLYKCAHLLTDRWELCRCWLLCLNQVWGNVRLPTAWNPTRQGTSCAPLRRPYITTAISPHRTTSSSVTEQVRTRNNCVFETRQIPSRLTSVCRWSISCLPVNI